jgi:flagellar basal-body rod protein FlgG
MLENLNTAAAGMLAQQQRIAAVANDLANASTTGYKHTRTGFRDLVYTEAGRAQTGGVRVGAGVAVTDAGRSFGQGALQNTGEPLDVAIQGEGFLRVKLADGRMGLTRDGNLQLDARGRLSTASGALLQPPITVPAGTAADDIAIGPDGTVRAAGKALGRLDVVTVRAPGELLAAGDNAFVATAASGAAVRAPAATRVSQGVLESSNVDMGDEMVEMIDAQRAYQMASKAITTADEMLQIANGIRR